MNLTTTRLTLREYKESDFKAVFALDTDTEILRMRGRPAITLEESQHRFETIIQAQQEQPRERFAFIIEDQAERSLIGRCRLQITDPKIREAEIGYHLTPQAWGRGYATETARELLRFGFLDLNLHRIMAKCYIENNGSIHVMEKIGMQFEGHIRQNRWLNGAWTDTLIYSILSHERRN